MRLPSAYNKTREWILQIAENPSAEVEKLPAERQICSILNVSRDTVRRVIASFVEEGILEVRHGNGTYLNAPAIRRLRTEPGLAGALVANARRDIPVLRWSRIAGLFDTLFRALIAERGEASCAADRTTP